MDYAHDELQDILRDLERLAVCVRQEDIQRPLKRLQEAAESVGQAWSRSWLGYHANVYYRNFQPPPPGIHFSGEWGLMESFSYDTSRDWVEYKVPEVTEAIHRAAGNPDIKLARTFNNEAVIKIRRRKRQLTSIIEIELSNSNSSFLTQLKEELANISMLTANDIIQIWAPKEITSRDSLAVSQGLWNPPHISILSQVRAIQHTMDVITGVKEITEQVASHIVRQRRRPQVGDPLGKRIFIGHGHSQTWRELKDFLEDRLNLPVDEFNRISPAGISNTSRLSAMMDSTSVAFLVMTGEDEQPDGKLRARENVVHEAGLFQGRLGFLRAIVLLEEGCEEFSNNAGLGHIPFPKGNIKAAFESVREVLEREGVLGVNY